MQALRTIHRFWSALLFLAVPVQIGAAGYGAFYAADKADSGPLTEDSLSSGFDVHNGFGYTIFLGTLVLLLLALGALGRRRLLMTVMAFVLLIVQILRAWGGEAVPAIGTFHPLNAFLIAGLTGRLAYDAWWGTRTAAPAPATA